ncbi:hypothetical protein MNBD_PLANCTO02-1782 [hydrothermal vent metagenome]|uniref:Serine aminopeptidase S33 domain-containing protein n=1 Tax=hydrothermal vent metagenome TaxID=652676 RepID=A0A3B1CY75_9ZZZZ
MSEQQSQQESSDISENMPPKKVKKWYQRVGRLLLFYVVVPYLILFVLLGIFQRNLLYHRGQVSALLSKDNTPSDIIVRDIQVSTEGDLKVNGWHYLPSSQKSNGGKLKENEWLVLYFPGNAGNRARRLYLPQSLVGINFHLMICDYRGYADNPGTPSEQALFTDAEALWKFAIEEKGASPERIIIYGESLGGGVATHLASFACQNKKPPAGLLLSSTFSSMADAAANLYPFFPVRLLLLDQYNSAEKIKHVTCPVMQIHGTLDRIVSLEIGKKLFNATPEKSSSGVKKQFEELSDSGHNNIPVSVIIKSIQILAKMPPYRVEQ